MAAAFAAGIALAGASPPPALWAALSAALCLAVAAAALRPAARPRGALVALVLAALACGLLRAEAVPSAADPRPVVGLPPPAPRSGQVVDGPWPLAGGGASCDVRLADGRTSVRLYSEGPLAPVATGDVVVFRSALVPRRPSGNPGAPPWRPESPAWLASVRSAADVVRLADARPSLRERLVRGRDALAGRVVAALGPRSGGVLAAIALGARRLVPPDERERLAATGTAHALAVSGLHLTVVGFWLYAIVGWLLRRSEWLLLRVRLHRVQALLTLAGMAAFTLLTGAAVSTLRALSMAAVLLVGRALGRTGSGPTALSVAALALLAADPAALGDVSFQLSVSAVAAILWAAPLGERLTGLIVPGVTAGPLLGRAGRALLSGLWVSAAASLGTAPVLAAQLHRVAPFSVVANVVAVPLMTLVVLPLGLLGVALTALLPAPAAPTILALPGGAVDLWLGAVAALAEVAPDPPVAPGAAVVALCGGPLLILLAVRLPRRAARAALGAGALLLTAPLLLRVPTAPPDGFRATILDVGHGVATVLQLPDGATWLVDGGGRADGSPGAGTSRVVPALRALGVRRVDVMVASHGHADHAAGLVAVAAAFPVDELWTPGAAWSEPAQRLERTVRAAGGRVRRVDAGHPPHAAGGVELRVLWPPAHPERAPPRRGDGENDRSLVLRVAAPGGTLLLPGDVEAPAEAALLATGAQPAATVVVAPHHGSATSSTAAFIAAVRPRAVIWSRGPGGRPALPAAAVARRWRAVGAVAFDTALDGAIDVRADALALTVCGGRPEPGARGARCLAVSAPAGPAAVGAGSRGPP
jgi:competence protein ComEC